MNFVGAIWMTQGTRKLMCSNGTTIMELKERSTGVPLVLQQSIKIPQHSEAEIRLECTRKLSDKMDIRIDSGFHHHNPNVYIPPSCLHNPNNEFNPRPNSPQEISCQGTPEEKIMYLFQESQRVVARGHNRRKDQRPDFHPSTTQD